MTNPDFIASSDAATLYQRAAAMHHATAGLLQALLLDLGAEEHQRIDTLLADGGRLGIEATVDGMGTTSLCMVGFTGTGERLRLLTVKTPGTGSASH